MSSLVRWDPFRELEDMSERLNRWLGRTMRREARETLTMAEWSPTVDIVETDNEYLIKAELPEVKKEDVHVNMQDDMLVLQGERKLEREEKGRRYHRVERAYGRFERTFSVPDDADGKGIRADFKDGVLNVHLPKTPGAKPKRTEIEIK